MNLKRLAFLGGILVLILLGGLWLASVLKKHRQEAAPPVTPALASTPYEKNELQDWIKMLSSSDAIERKRAESELASAGVFADEPLKAAQSKADGAAREAIQRLLNRRRFAGLQDLDYAKALPSDALGYLQVPNIQQSIEIARQTPFGKLAMRPAFDAIRAKIWNQIQHEDSGEMRQPPVEYFKGQFAAAAFKTAEGSLAQTTKLGLLLELKGEDPQGEYLDWSSKLLKSGGAIRDYKNIETLEAGSAKGAHVRTGNTLIFGSDADALHMLIDTVLSARSIKTNAEVAQVRAVLSGSSGAAPGAQIVADVPAIATEILMAKKAGPKKPDDDLFELIFENFGYAGAATACKAGGFEDRVTLLLPEGPGSVAEAFSAPASAPAIASFQVVPSDAIAAFMIHIDGAKLEKASIEFYNKVRDHRGAGPGGLPPITVAQPFISIRFVEKLLGLKEGGLFSLVNGEVGAWLELRPGDDFTKAELSALITSTDNKSAEELASVLDRLNQGKPAGVLIKSDYNQHSVRYLNEAAGKELLWTVDKNRVYFARTVQSMKKLLDNLQTQMPSLLKREPLQKALANFAADERSGNVLYMDIQALLTSGAETYFPKMISDPTTPLEIRQALTQLPPPVDLFNNFPPLLAFTQIRKDRAEFIVNSPAPIIPIALLALAEELDKNKNGK